MNATESQAYNPVLTVGRSKTEITVTGEPPQLETSNATLGATMENETYSALPIEMGAYGNADQRRATDFVYLMPGVQGNVTNGNATTNTGVVNGSGSRGAVSAVYIDGVPFVVPAATAIRALCGLRFQLMRWTSSRSRRLATRRSMKARE